MRSTTSPPRRPFPFLARSVVVGSAITSESAFVAPSANRHSPASDICSARAQIQTPAIRATITTVALRVIRISLLFL